MPQPKTGHVFVSYSRRDEAVMRRIVKHLRTQGIKAWVDNEKLVPGTPVWENEIEKAIKGAFAIVVVLSPDAKKSEWVLREITLADHHNKRAFPVLVTGKNEDSIPFRLITRQFVDLRKDEKTGLNSLSSAISFYLDELTRLEEERQAAEREIERLKQEREKAEFAARKAEEIAEAERKAKEQAEQLARAKAEEERIAKAKLEAERIARKKEEKKRAANAKLEVKDRAKQKPTQELDKGKSSIYGTIYNIMDSIKSNKYTFTGLLILTGFIVLLGINQFIESQNANKAAFVNATNTAVANAISIAKEKATNTAIANEKATNTAFWAAVRSTNTAIAEAKSTNTAYFAASRSTNTAIADNNATNTAVAVDSIISSVQNDAQLVYGPKEGNLKHDNDNRMESASVSFDLKNFIVEATFTNPYSSSTGSWSYGFLFREEDTYNQYRLFISSTNETWSLWNHTGEKEGDLIQQGKLSNLDTGSGGSNKVWLLVEGKKGLLFVNGELIAELDLSARTNYGSVRIGTGFYLGHEIEGYSTDYTDFSVWEIP